MSFIFNTTNLIFISSVMTIFSIPFANNFFIFQNIPQSLPIPNIIIYCAVTLFTLIPVGILNSIYASKIKCNKYRFKIALWEAIKFYFWTIIAYIGLYFFPFIKNPFLELFGKNAIVHSSVEGLFMTLNGFAALIVCFFNSQKKGCELTEKEVNKALRKIDKHLNSRKKKERTKKIKIKN